MGGMIIPAATSAAIAGAGEIIVYAVTSAKAAAMKASIAASVPAANPFRPPQWSSPALTMITVPASYVNSQSAGSANPLNAVSGSSPAVPANTTPQFLVFDGVMRVSHSQPMTATEHPIQDAANLTDHIRANQATITMDVLMTDVLPAYAVGQWVGNASKSISCFDTLDALRLARVPLTLTTRLKTYSPVFIMNVIPDDTAQTQFGLRCRVEFKQMFLFSVATQTNSARNQTTGSSAVGTTAVQPVTSGVTAQNGMPSSSTGVQSSSAIQTQSDTVIGAGNWSSNNTGQLTEGPLG
jgi:hypothetical protein